jgi:pimeloyl-ACP methyl ester carboxylesterase
MEGELVLSDDSADGYLPTIVTVPCFSGAPWDLEKLEALSDLPLKTMRLPEGLDEIEEYADFVGEQVSDLDCHVLMGDSFGAVVSLALASRQPSGLRALVMSGGFAANPVRNPLLRARIKAARFLRGPLYRAITLRMHAASLSSPYDAEGQVPWSEAESHRFFKENTPYRSYLARADAALDADYLDRLPKINVPTLIITPSHDTLIGKEAAVEMLQGIPDSREVVVERTGHMLRYSHPVTYSKTVRAFLVEQFGDGLTGACV